jgi:hypothetical protein
VTRLAALLALLGAAVAPFQESPDKPSYPPAILVVTAQTGKLVPGDLQPLLNAIKRMQGFARQTGRVKVPGEWMENWTFEISGDKKFDPTPFWGAFAGRFNATKYHLTMTGTLSQEEKTQKLFITTFSGKSKVKLMNRPKNVFDKGEAKAEDKVGQLAGLLKEGKLHFTVAGEIFNHGGTLAILLETYDEAPAPPPRSKEEK